MQPQSHGVTHLLGVFPMHFFIAAAVSAYLKEGALQKAHQGTNLMLARETLTYQHVIERRWKSCVTAVLWTVTVRNKAHSALKLQAAS